MKTSEKRDRTGSSAVLRIPLTAVVLMVFFIAGNAMAARERFVLDYNESTVRSHRGEPATLFLKKALKDQYPSVNVADLELRRVVLIAKSRRGQGSAQLRVGNRQTEAYQVDGRPGRFRDDRRDIFDRTHFTNPSYDSRGVWQIDLHGNFVVDKVVLEVDDRSRRHHNARRYNF
ncbi:MAG: hypothetical protein VR65_16415 [Desulfobulbaceae bacterium BRH_c16a]|nr:MAG: hypothetical protein VR65_16415 [Desulfobulbaceae bacterium BRH_c16a]